MLDEADDFVLFRGGDQFVVMREELGCGFGNENVNPSLDGINCDFVVGACDFDGVN
jgi:hypothetical protein